MLETNVNRLGIRRFDYMKRFVKKRQDNSFIKFLFLKWTSYHYAQQYPNKQLKRGNDLGFVYSPAMLAPLSKSLAFLRRKKSCGQFINKKRKLKQDRVMISGNKGKESDKFLYFDCFVYNYFERVGIQDKRPMQSNDHGLKPFCIPNFNVNGNAKDTESKVTYASTPELKNKMGTPWWMRSKRGACDTMFYSPISSPIRDRIKQKENISNSKESILEKRRQHRDNRPKPWKSTACSKSTSKYGKFTSNNHKNGSTVDSHKHLHAEDANELSPIMMLSPLKSPLLWAADPSREQNEIKAPEEAQGIVQQDKYPNNPKRSLRPRSNMSQNKRAQKGMSRFTQNVTNEGKIKMNCGRELIEWDRRYSVANISNRQMQPNIKREASASYFDAVSCSGGSTRFMFSPRQATPRGTGETELTKQGSLNADQVGVFGPIKKKSQSEMRTRRVKRELKPSDPRSASDPWDSTNRHPFSRQNFGKQSFNSVLATSPKHIYGRKRGPIILETSPPLLSLRNINPITTKARNMINSYSQFLKGETFIPEKNNSKLDNDAIAGFRKICLRKGRTSPNKKSRRKIEKTTKHPDDILLKHLSPTRVISSPTHFFDDLNNAQSLKHTNARNGEESESEFGRTRFRRTCLIKQPTDNRPKGDRDDIMFANHHENKLCDNQKPTTGFETDRKRNISRSIPSLMRKVNQDIEKKVKSMVDSYSRYLLAEKSISMPTSSLEDCKSHLPQIVNNTTQSNVNRSTTQASRFRKNLKSHEAIKNKQSKNKPSIPYTTNGLEKLVKTLDSKNDPCSPISKGVINYSSSEDDHSPVKSPGRHNIRFRLGNIHSHKSAKKSESRIAVVKSTYIGKNEVSSVRQRKCSPFQQSVGKVEKAAKKATKESPFKKTQNRAVTENEFVRLTLNNRRCVKDPTGIPSHSLKNNTYSYVEYPPRRSQGVENVLARATHSVGENFYEKRNLHKCNEAISTQAIKNEMMLPSTCNSFTKWFSNREQKKMESTGMDRNKERRLVDINQANQNNGQQIKAVVTVSPNKKKENAMLSIRHLTRRSYSSSSLSPSHCRSSYSVSPSSSCCANTCSDTRLNFDSEDSIHNFNTSFEKSPEHFKETSDNRKEERRVRFLSSLLKKNITSESEDTRALLDSMTSTWDDEISGSQSSPPEYSEKAVMSVNDKDLSKDRRSTRSGSHQTRSEAHSTTQKRYGSNHSEDEESMKNMTVSNNSSESTMRNIPELEINEETTGSANFPSHHDDKNGMQQRKANQKTNIKHNETVDFNFSNKGVSASNSAPCLSSSFDKNSMPLRRKTSFSKSISDTYLFNDYIKEVFKVLKSQFKKNKKRNQLSKKFGKSNSRVKVNREIIRRIDKRAYNKSNMHCKHKAKGSLNTIESCAFRKQENLNEALKEENSFSFFSIDQECKSKGDSLAKGLKKSYNNFINTDSPKSLPSFDQVLSFWEKNFGNKRGIRQSQPRLHQRVKAQSQDERVCPNCSPKYIEDNSTNTEHLHENKEIEECNQNEHHVESDNDYTESFISLRDNDDSKVKSSFKKSIQVKSQKLNDLRKPIASNTLNRLKRKQYSQPERHCDLRYLSNRRSYRDIKQSHKNGLSPYAIVAKMASSVKSRVMNALEQVISHETEAYPVIKSYDKPKEPFWNNESKQLSSVKEIDRAKYVIRRKICDNVNKPYKYSRIPVPVLNKHSNQGMNKMGGYRVSQFIVETPKCGQLIKNQTIKKPKYGSKTNNFISHPDKAHLERSDREEEVLFYRISSGLDSSPSLTKEGRATASRSSRPITHLTLDSPMDNFHKTCNDRPVSVNDIDYDEDKMHTIKYLMREPPNSKSSKHMKQVSRHVSPHNTNHTNIYTTDKESTFAGHTDDFYEFSSVPNKLHDTFRQSPNIVSTVTQPLRHSYTKDVSVSHRKAEYKPTVSVGISPTVSKADIVSVGKGSTSRDLGVLESPRSDVEIGKQSSTLNSKTASICETAFKTSNALKHVQQELSTPRADKHDIAAYQFSSANRIEITTKPNAESIENESTCQTAVREFVCIACQTNTDVHTLNKAETINILPTQITMHHERFSKMVQTSPMLNVFGCGDNLKKISEILCVGEKKETNHTTSSAHQNESSLTEEVNSTTFDSKHAVHLHKQDDNKDTSSSSTPGRGSGDGLVKEMFVNYKHIEPKENTKGLPAFRMRSKNKVRPSLQSHTHKGKSKHRGKQLTVYQTSSDQNISKNDDHYSRVQNADKGGKSRHNKIKPSTSDSDVLSLAENRQFASISDNYHIQLSQASKNSTKYHVRHGGSAEGNVEKHADSLSNSIRNKEKDQSTFGLNDAAYFEKGNDRNRQHNHTSKKKDSRGIEIVLGNGLPVEKFVDSFIGGLTGVSKTPFDSYSKADDLMKLPKKKSVVVQLSPSPNRKYPFRHRRPEFKDITGYQPNSCFSNSGYLNHDFRLPDTQWNNTPTKRVVNRCSNIQQGSNFGDQGSHNKSKHSRRQIFEDSTKKKHGLRHCSQREKHPSRISGIISPNSSRSNTITESRTFCNDLTLRSSHCSNDNHFIVNGEDKKKPMVQGKNFYSGHSRGRHTIDMPEKKPSQIISVTAPCSFPLKGKTVNAILSSDPSTMKKQVELLFVDTETSQTSKIIVEPETEEEPSWPNVVSKNDRVYVSFHKEKRAESNKEEKQNSNSQDQIRQDNQIKDKLCNKEFASFPKYENQLICDEQRGKRRIAKKSLKRNRRVAKENEETSTEISDKRLQFSAMKSNSSASGDDTDEISCRENKRERGRKYNYRNQSYAMSRDRDRESVSRLQGLKKSEIYNRTGLDCATRCPVDGFQNDQIYSKQRNIIEPINVDKYSESEQKTTGIRRRGPRNQKECGEMEYASHHSEADPSYVSVKTTNYANVNPAKLLHEDVQNLINHLQQYIKRDNEKPRTSKGHKELLENQKDNDNEESLPASLQEKLKCLQKQLQSLHPTSQTDAEQSKTTEPADSCNVLYEQNISKDQLQKKSLLDLNLNDTVLRNAVLKVISENIRLYSDTDRSLQTHSDTPNTDGTEKSKRDAMSETIRANITANKAGPESNKESTETRGTINGVCQLPQPENKRESQRSLVMGEEGEDEQDDTWQNEKPSAPETSMFDQLEKTMLSRNEHSHLGQNSSYESKDQSKDMEKAHLHSVSAWAAEKMCQFRREDVKREDSGYITPKDKETNFQTYFRQHRIKPSSASSTDDITERSCAETEYKNALQKNRLKNKEYKDYTLDRGLVFSKNRQEPSEHSIETEDSFMKACDSNQLTPLRGPFSIRKYGISHLSLNDEQLGSSNFTSDGISSGNNMPLYPSLIDKDRQPTARVWWRDQEGPKQKLYYGQPSFEVSHLENGRQHISVKNAVFDRRPTAQTAVKERSTSITPAADRIHKRYQDTVHISPRFEKRTFIHRKIGSLRDRSLINERLTGGHSYDRRNKSPFSYNSQSSLQSSNIDDGVGGSLAESKPVDAWDRAVVDKLKTIRYQKCNTGY